MVRVSLFAVFIFATMANGKVIPMIGGGRIVGGASAAEGQFPYQISLRRYDSHSCGGSIYNKRWIVTAGHCVDGASPVCMTVVAGSTRLSTGGDSYNVEKIIVHPSFNPWELTSDIALLKVTEDIQFNEYVQPIPLSTQYVGESESVASGWGTTSYPGSIPDRLQFIELITLTNNECADRHASTGIPIVDTEICTLTKRGEGMCHGDSGGPLVVNGALTGIVSWGNPCANGYPDVFTRVFSFKSWIEINAVV